MSHPGLQDSSYIFFCLCFFLYCIPIIIQSCAQWLSKGIKLSFILWGKTYNSGYL